MKGRERKREEKEKRREEMSEREKAYIGAYTMK